MKYFCSLMMEIWLKHVSWWTRLAPHVHAYYNKMRPSQVYYCFVPQNLLIGHSLVQSDSCNSVISHDLAAIKIVFWPSSITIRCRDCSLIEGILTHPIHPVYQIHQTPDSCSFISCSKLMKCLNDMILGALHFDSTDVLNADAPSICCMWSENCVP